jgi:hypothetical protein
MSTYPVLLTFTCANDLLVDQHLFTGLSSTCYCITDRITDPRECSRCTLQNSRIVVANILYFFENYPNYHFDDIYSHPEIFPNVKNVKLAIRIYEKVCDMDAQYVRSRPHFLELLKVRLDELKVAADFVKPLNQRRISQIIEVFKRKFY